MTPSQRDQYESFARDSYLKFKSGELFGKAKLDEYTRLRQLAFARCKLEGKKLKPTDDSGKLEVILQDLTELGVPQRKGTDQVVIFSQFNTALDMIERWLNKMKVNSMMLTGRQTQRQRDEVQRAFQAREVRVALVNIKAGGVAIELDEADTAMFLDETNNPDHCEQAENRLHRASKIHHVRCLYYRSNDTIEEDLFDDVLQRQAINVEILDLRRQYASA
jgi:SNF2 family DNA or RNA helicase